MSIGPLCRKEWDTVAPVVRFFPLIGQPAMLPGYACPILPAYRTTSYATWLRLSDSSCLSDKPLCYRTTLVRFFLLIGQTAMLPDHACPILPAYRTTRYANGSMQTKNKDCLQMRQSLFQHSYLCNLSPTLSFTSPALSFRSENRSNADSFQSPALSTTRRKPSISSSVKSSIARNSF